MKILFISAVYPWPLASGGQVRVFELLKRLGTEHAITLATFTRTGNESGFASNLPFIRRILTGYRGRALNMMYLIRAAVSRYPWLYESYRHRELREAIESELGKHPYDLVHIEPSYVWPVLPSTTLPLVTAEHNIEYRIYERYIAAGPFLPLRPFMKYDVLKHRITETDVWRRSSALVAVSDSDAGVIRGSVSTPVYIVPNAVDTEKYAFSERMPARTGLRCVFIGDFRWIQNRDAIQYLTGSVFPEILRSFPDATLQIIGRDLPVTIQRRIRNPRIHYLGFVPDIPTATANSHVLLCPIRIGGGTKYKILEAFAMGLAVVASETAVEGMHARRGHDYWHAETPHEYVRILRELVSRIDTVKQVTKNARALVTARYTWDKSAMELGRVWRTVHEQSHLK